MSFRATQRREQSFEAFARQARDALGEAVYQIILYGSTARSEATETSDVDIFIVLAESTREQHRDTISAIAFDVGLNYDVAISYHIQSRDRFDSRQHSPYLQNVLRDGRVHE